MKNWKTTLCGVLMAVGGFLATQDQPTMKLAGQGLIVIAPILFGLSAKDHNTTGGSKPQTTEAAERLDKK